MSEAAETISTADAPPARPDRSGSVSPQTTGSSKRPKTAGTGPSRLLLISAVGAAIGFMAGVGIYSELREKSLEFIPITMLAALAAYVFREPGEALKGNEVDESESARRERGMVWALTSAGMGIAFESAFDHSIDAALSLSADKVSGVAALSNDGLTRTLMVLVIVGLAAVGMMSFWVWGAKRRWRAAVAGGAVGLAFGLFACVVGLAVLQYLGGLDALNSAGIHPVWLRIAGAMVILWFLGLGIFGGVAIDRRRTSSITIDLVSYLSVFSLAYAALLLLMWHVWKVQYSDKSIAAVAIPEFAERWAWLPVAAALFQVVGWSVALHRNRELCEFHLGARRDAPEPPKPHADPDGPVIGLPPLAGPVGPSGDRTPTLSPSGSTTIAVAEVAGAGVVLNFPRPEGQPLPPQASLDTQSRGERAKNLLLKPTGDRLLATAALVVALVGTAVAYHLGTLRGDPLVLIDIAQNLQKDSGLSGKDLQVHSDGRVVTLVGRVDNEAEHAKAVREVMSVRGVKQLIDQINVAPATPPASSTISSPAGDSAQPLVPVIDATISIGGATGKGGSIANGPAAMANAKSSRSQKPVATAKTEGSQKAVETPKTAEAPKHKGLLNFLKKDKNNQASATDAKKTADTPKTTDAEKHKGLFNFLKKDKDKNNNGNKNVTPVPNNKNDKSNKNPKKEGTKNPAVH